MIDISKQTVELDCPECKREILVSLKQVPDEITVSCSCGLLKTLKAHLKS